MRLSVGILTVSDRCSSGETPDESGCNLKKLFETGELFDASVRDVIIVPDEVAVIQEAVLKLCSAGCHVVLTTGGTGVAPCDVTPDAVSPLLERPLPGLVAAMMNGSLALTPLAALSRPVAGVRGACVIVTLPGSKTAAEQCVRLVSPALPHALDLIMDRRRQVQMTHSSLQQLQDRDSEEHHTHRRCAGSAALSGRDAPHSADTPPLSEHYQSKVDVGKIRDRSRKSEFPAVSVEAAKSIVMRQIKAVMSTVDVPILESEGLVLALDVHAAVSLPPYRASVKDGYAVRSADAGQLDADEKEYFERRVVGVSHAGVKSGVIVGEGQCVRISTGAQIPTGADAVVMLEDTQLVSYDDDDSSPSGADDGDGERAIKFYKKAVAGQDIRETGSEFRAGDLLLNAGTVIAAFELAALSSAAVRHVTVFRRPCVSLMSGGDELVDITGLHSSDGGGDRVYDANRHALASLIRKTGALVHDLGIVGDSADDLLSAVRHGLQVSDILVTSGGVSMGERDLLKRVLVTDLGATIHFGRVWMKPGLPTTFASLKLDGRTKFVFGLPGNPVSAAVCCVLHVQPALRRVLGVPEDQCIRTISVTLDSSVSPGDRPEYIRAHVNNLLAPKPTAKLTTKDQRSCNVLSLLGCNVLLQIPSSNRPLLNSSYCDKGTHISSGGIVSAIVV